MNIPFSPESIKTESDIKDFFVWLVDNQNLNFHCDTPFEDYVYCNTDDRVYTDAEAALLNAVMDKCFEIKEICSFSDLFDVTITGWMVF